MMKIAGHWLAIGLVLAGCSGEETTGGGGGGASGGGGGATGGGGLGGQGGGSTPCGDGVQQGTEACDDGPANSDITPDACRTDCTLPRCDDGVVDGAHGEICDPGALGPGESCASNCRQLRVITDLGVSGVAYDLARDNTGGVHLLWKQSNALHHGRVETGALVGSQTLPGTSGVHTRFTRPRLAVQPDGSTVHTSWINATGAVGQLLYHSYRDGNGDWQQPEMVWNGGTTQRVAVPAIGVEADGAVQIIAERRDIVPSEGNWQIVGWRKPQAGAWSAPQNIHGPTGIGWRACSIFTDRQGGLHATWKGANQAGKYRHAPSGQSLAAANTIDIPKPAGESHVSNGDSYVDEAGAVHHAFVTFPTLGIYDAVKGAGDSAFAAPVKIATADSSDQYDPWPTVGVDPSGRVLVSWAEDRQAPVAGGAPFAWLAIAVGNTWALEEWDTTAHIPLNGRTAIVVTDTASYLLWRDGQDRLMLARITFSSP